jgi:hypothetical protein
MKTFKSIIMVKYPRNIVWETIRDRLPELVPFLDDVADIVPEHRQEHLEGSLELINIWKADIKIPPILHSVIDPSTLSWTDRAKWNESQNICHWAIEPHFLPDRIRCSGRTQFEEAMGGRGTRINFEGALEVTTKDFPGLPAFMEVTATQTIESLVASLIPKNFRKVTDALSHLLNQDRSPN